MTIGAKQSVQQPTAVGTLINSSAYGQTIPVILGLTRCPMYPIWANGLRKGNSNKKGKGKKKGEPPTYVEDVDFLIGHNPIQWLGQIWNNNNVKAPLNLVKSSGFTGSGGSLPTTVTISDPYFYQVIGVTAYCPYSETFNDYGGPGSVTLTGNFEIPLWNEAILGPDPTYPMAARMYPYVCYVNGSTITFPTGGATADWIPEWNTGSSLIYVYYYQLSSAISRETPATVLRLEFESELGSGTEFTNYPSQQILYPMYAGAGSPDIDMGFAAAIPQIQPEVAGSIMRYPTGDCDFMDMAEYTVKSGPVQAAVSSTSLAQIPTQIGAGMYSMPGPIQHAGLTYFESGGIGAMTYRHPVSVGNLLIAFWTGFGAGGGTGSIADTLGNTWNAIEYSTDGTGYYWLLGYSFATVGGSNNRVNFSWSGGGMGNHNTAEIMEVVGVDTFDTSALGSVTAGNPLAAISLTTGNMRNFPAFVFAGVAGGGGGNFNTPSNQDPRWKLGFPGSGPFQEFGNSLFRTAFAPQAIQLKGMTSVLGTTRVLLASFKSTKAPSYPKPYGELLDNVSLDVVRKQARANGLWGSICMNSQRKASDWLKDFYWSSDAEGGFTGHKLYSFPRSEVSTVGNGAVYPAPTASGPVANLSDLNGDFVDGKTPTLSHDPQFGLPNIVQVQYYARTSDYAQTVSSEPETAAEVVLGVRKGSPLVHNEIADPTIARNLIEIEARRNQYAKPWTWQFTLQPRWDLLSLYDLVTITDTLAGINEIPVRLTKVVYGKDGTVQCQAEPFRYGMNATSGLSGQTNSPYVPPVTQDAGPVNTPIIFEAVPRLFSSESQAELWVVVSGAATNYGGCVVYISTDGGNSYNAVGTITSNGITGATTADWPIASDPDTTNNLPVDLTESNGVLSSYLAADRDNFTYPCYIAGGNASIPYGLMTYNTATLTATSKYTLEATGAGNELRRCVFGAPVAQPGPDVDHPSGSRWAFLGNPAQPNQPGVFRMTLDPKYVGTTLYFKFIALNIFGFSAEQLPSVTAYSFTPTGIPGGGIAQNQSNYANTPALALSQTSTTNLALAQVSTKFSTNTVNYNARSTITIPTVTSPTWYYIYIIDPSYVGDTGSGTNLSVQVDTTQAHLGVPGYTFMGAIQALPSGFSSAIVLPGGYPPPAANLFG